MQFEIDFYLCNNLNLYQVYQNNILILFSAWKPILNNNHLQIKITTTP